MKKYKIIDRKRLTVGEGPTWDSALGCVYYIDFLGHEIRRCDMESGRIDSIQPGFDPGCIGSPSDSGDHFDGGSDGSCRIRYCHADPDVSDIKTYNTFVHYLGKDPPDRTCPARRKSINRGRPYDGEDGGYRHGGKHLNLQRTRYRSG